MRLSELVSKLSQLSPDLVLKEREMQYGAKGWADKQSGAFSGPDLDFRVKEGHDETILNFVPAKKGVQRTVGDLYEALAPLEDRQGNNQVVNVHTTPIEVSVWDKGDECYVFWVELDYTDDDSDDAYTKDYKPDGEEDEEP